jgi:hypothetical protein
MNRLLLLVQERTISFLEGASFNFEKDYPLIFARDGVESFYIAEIAYQIGLLEGSEGGPSSEVPPDFA